MEWLRRIVRMVETTKKALALVVEYEKACVGFEETACALFEMAKAHQEELARLRPPDNPAAEVERLRETIKGLEYSLHLAKEQAWINSLGMERAGQDRLEVTEENVRLIEQVRELERRIVDRT